MFSQFKLFTILILSLFLNVAILFADTEEQLEQLLEEAVSITLSSDAKRILILSQDDSLAIYDSQQESIRLYSALEARENNLLAVNMLILDDTSLQSQSSSSSSSPCASDENSCECLLAKNHESCETEASDIAHECDVNMDFAGCRLQCAGNVICLLACVVNGCPGECNDKAEQYENFCKEQADALAQSCQDGNQPTRPVISTPDTSSNSCGENYEPQTIVGPQSPIPFERDQGALSSRYKDFGGIS